MRLSQKIDIAVALLENKVTHRRIPLLINWSLTDRCNYKCGYCEIWKRNSPELATGQVFSVIDKLAAMGNKAISFSGGETLVREDIGVILDRCRKKGIFTKLNTNGALVAEKIREISSVDTVKLSFDGPAEIHDRHRQSGSFDQVMLSAKLLKNRNIKVAFNCVISELNVGYLGYVLQKASELNIQATFQPLEYRNKGGFSGPRPAPEGAYKRALSEIISLKLKGNKLIANSLPGLRYLFNWPNYRGMKCWAGSLHFRISPDGKFVACDRLREAESALDCLSDDFASKFKRMPINDCSNGCWRNTTAELNFLLSWNPSALRNVLNIL